MTTKNMPPCKTCGHSYAAHINVKMGAECEYRRCDCDMYIPHYR